MGIGVSLILIAVGATLTWAVTDNVSNVDLSTVGVILMVVGLAGGLISTDVLVELGRLRRLPPRDGRARRARRSEIIGTLIPCRGRGRARPRHHSSLPPPSIERFAGGAVVALSGRARRVRRAQLRGAFEAVLESGPRSSSSTSRRVTFLDSTVARRDRRAAPAAARGRRRARTVLPETAAGAIVRDHRTSPPRSTSGRAGGRGVGTLRRRELLAHANDGARR